jgi:hypothetical protein
MAARAHDRGQATRSAAAAAVAQDYGEAQVEAPQNALGAVALVAIHGLWFTRKLPVRAGAGDAVSSAPAEPSHQGAVEEPDAA